MISTDYNIIMKKIILLIIAAIIILFIYSEHTNSQDTGIIPAETSSDVSEVVESTDEPDLSIQDSDYEFDVENSSITWSGETLIKGHTGTVEIQSLAISEDEGLFSGVVVVDMNTIIGDAGAGLDSHLKDTDFFDVTNHPTSTLSFDETTSGVFNGVLTVRGVSLPVSFVANRTTTDAGLRISTSIEFDRTAYGVNYQSSKFADVIKEKAIDDEIQLDVVILLRK